MEGCGGGLIDFLAEFDLVDGFRLDSPGRGVWTWMGNFPSGRVSGRSVGADFVSCPTVPLIGGDWPWACWGRSPAG